MFDILFCGADIITMCDESPVIREGFVGVTGKKVSYAGREKPEGDAARIIDCKHKILMPGLVNAHTHTAMCLLRGYADDYALQDWLYNKVFPVEAKLTPKAVMAGVRLGFAEMLRTGTTSISDMYYFQPQMAQLALDCGIRASICNAVIAFDEDAFDPKADRAILETIELAEYFHGKGDGRIRADAAIHAEYTSTPKTWRTVVGMAQKYGLCLQVHLSETEAEHKECIGRHGKTPAAVMAENRVFDVKAIAAHCVWITDDDMDILAQKGVSCAHNPVGNLKLASGIARVKAMQERGMNVALGTDGCCSNNTHDLFEEIKAAALLAKGTSLDPTALSAYEALKLATVNGARAQGRENEIGKIQAGMEADIILVDLSEPMTRPVYDPVSAIVYSVRGSDVCLTMVQGRVLYENGLYHTIDIERAIEEADMYAKKIANGEAL